MWGKTDALVFVVLAADKCLPMIFEDIYREHRQEFYCLPRVGSASHCTVHPLSSVDLDWTSFHAAGVLWNGKRCE